MADNYLEFSEVILELTRDESAWLERQLESIAVFDTQVYLLDKVPEHLDAQQATYRGPRFLRDAKQIDVCGDTPDFKAVFLDEQRGGHHSRQLWIYAECHGSLEQVALLVQTFLRKFRPKDIWTISYAATCSKPRVGEFGGGVVIVTAKRVRWHDSGVIAANAVNAHDRRRRAA